MWNLKSGVSFRSRSRMESQISSGGVGTGGRDPPRGPVEVCFSEEGPGGKKTAPPPSARRVYNGKIGASGGPGRWPRKTREKRRAVFESRCRQEVHRRTLGDLVPWLAST